MSNPAANPGRIAQRELRAGDVEFALELGPPARGTLLMDGVVAAVFVSESYSAAVESACSYLRGAGLDEEAKGLAKEWRKRVEL